MPCLPCLIESNETTQNTFMQPSKLEDCLCDNWPSHANFRLLKNPPIFHNPTWQWHDFKTIFFGFYIVLDLLHGEGGEVLQNILLPSTDGVGMWAFQSGIIDNGSVWYKLGHKLKSTTKFALNTLLLSCTYQCSSTTKYVLQLDEETLRW